VAVIGAAAVDAVALEDAEEVIVLDSSPDELLAAYERLADARCSFLLGAPPVLPLPDAWVDAVVGAEAASATDLERVCR
jgi:ubiquinone/menaquinone biosynthesis C-methylase UbiE